MVWHPDRATGSEENFKKLVDAYKILGNTNSRIEYDRRLKITPETFTSRFSKVAEVATSTAKKVVNDFVSDGIFDTLDEILGRKKESNNLELDIKITLEELYSGSDKRVVFKRKELCDSCKGRGAHSPSDIEVCEKCYGIGHTMKNIVDFFTKETCKKCKGKGKVIKKKCLECKGKGENKYERDFMFSIPNDLNFGDAKDKLIVPNEGEYGGDLLLNIDVKPHKFYEVDWPHLYIKLPIKFYQAILGDIIEINTLQGPAVFKINPGTEYGNKFTLRKYGLRKTIKNGDIVFGDLHITLLIDIPKKLTKKQHQLLEDYKQNDRSRKKIKTKNI